MAFSNKVFIKTSFYERVLGLKRELVIGRKGSGKSAICLALRNSLVGDGYKVSLITPDSLSKQRIEKIESDAVTREEIYLLTWRYILLVKASLNFIELVDDLKIPYLRHDSDPVREIRGFLGSQHEIRAGFSQNLSSLVNVVNSISFNILGNGASIEKETIINGDSNLANIIPKFENKLSEVLGYLDDSQNTIFLLIDEVDEIWNENDESKLMISGLLRAAHQFNEKFKNAYAITFLRSDIFDTLKFHDIDKTPTQEEVLLWSPSSIKSLLGARAYVSSTGKKIGEDSRLQLEILKLVFREDVDDKNPIDYILDRTLMRPREAIQFCNLALNIAQDKGHETVREVDIVEAESRYSQWKLRDLVSEFQIQYPYLDVLLPMFNGFKVYFNRNDFSDRYLDSKSKLKKLFPRLKSYEDSTVLGDLFQIGLLGIASENVHPEKVIYKHSDLTTSDRLREFRPDGSNYFVIHPAYRLALGLSRKSYPRSISIGNFNAAQVITGDSNIVGNVVVGGASNISIGSSVNTGIIGDTYNHEIDIDINAVAAQLTELLVSASSNHNSPEEKSVQRKIVRDVYKSLIHKGDLESGVSRLIAEDRLSLVEGEIEHSLASELVNFLEVMLG